MKSLIKNTALISVILIFVSCQKDCYYEYNIINNFDRTIAYKGYVIVPDITIRERDTICYIEVGDTLKVFATHILRTKGKNEPIEDVLYYTHRPLGAIIFDDTLELRYNYGGNEVKNYYRDHSGPVEYRGRPNARNMSSLIAYYKVDDIDYLIAQKKAMKTK